MHSDALATLAGVLHDVGNGLLIIARGSRPLVLLGPADYGLRTGQLAAPARLLQGGTPLLFALVLDTLGLHAAPLLSGALTYSRCWPSQVQPASQKQVEPAVSAEHRVSAACYVYLPRPDPESGHAAIGQ
jgi:hypothetical protein